MIDKKEAISSLDGIILSVQCNHWIPPRSCLFYTSTIPRCLAHYYFALKRDEVIRLAISMVIGRSHPIDLLGSYYALERWQNDPKTTEAEVLRVLKQARSVLADYL